MRRFTRAHPEFFVYLFAAVTYIASGIWQKFLLNWIVGPVWLVACVEVWTRLRRSRRSVGEHDLGGGP